MEVDSDQLPSARYRPGHHVAGLNRLVYWSCSAACSAAQPLLSTLVLDSLPGLGSKDPLPQAQCPVFQGRI